MYINQVYDNGLVRVEARSNFDIDKWNKYLGVDFVPNLLKELKEVLLEVVNKRFEKGVGPDRKPWKALHPLTVRFKRATGGYIKRMMYTGRLRLSIKATVKATVLKGILTIYTKVPYAGVHQLGATFETTTAQSYWLWHNVFDKKAHPFESRTLKIPRRPFFGWGLKDKEIVIAAIKRYAKKSERMGS
jgi:phage gpG-like protein